MALDQRGGGLLPSSVYTDIGLGGLSLVKNFFFF